MSKSPRRPQRTCIGCRQVVGQAEMLRWIVDPQDPTRVLPDPRGEGPGRGAWLHPTESCAQQAVRRRAFARAFRSGGIAPRLEDVMDSVGHPCAGDGLDQQTRT